MSDIPEPSFFPVYLPSEKNILGKEKEQDQKNFELPFGFEPATPGFFCFLVLYKIPLTVVSGLEMSAISGDVQRNLRKLICELKRASRSRRLQIAPSKLSIKIPMLRRKFAKLPGKKHPFYAPINSIKDWLVQIPSPRGKKAVQMPHQLVLNCLSSKTNFVFNQAHWPITSEQEVNPV